MGGGALTIINLLALYYVQITIILIRYNRLTYTGTALTAALCVTILLIFHSEKVAVNSYDVVSFFISIFMKDLLVLLVRSKSQVLIIRP